MDCPCRRRHSRGFVIQTLVHMTPLYPVFCILSLMSWMSVFVCVCARILFNWGAGIRWRMELWLIFVQFKINCVQLLPRQPLPSHTHTNPATFSAIYNPIDECLRSGYRGANRNLVGIAGGWPEWLHGTRSGQLIKRRYGNVFILKR